MAQIPQINNPITAKNYNYSSRPMDPNTEPFDIVKLTGVQGAGSGSASSARSRLEMGNRELIPLQVQVAKDPTLAVETLKDLLNIEVLNQALINGHTELYGKLEDLAAALYVKPEELVQEIQNQEQQNTMFSGHEFYDVLREVAKTTTDPSTKELIGNLLKSINFAQNKNEILGALRANMKFLSEYFSPNEKLSAKLLNLSQEWGAADADKYFDYLKGETLAVLNDERTQMLIPLITHNLSRYNNSPYMCKEYFNLLLSQITSGTLRESLKNSFARLYSAIFNKQKMTDPQQPDTSTDNYTTKSEQNQPLTWNSSDKNSEISSPEEKISQVDENSGKGIVENAEDEEPELTGYLKFLNESMSEKGYMTALKDSGYNIEQMMTAYSRGRQSGFQTLQNMVKGLFIDDKTGEQTAQLMQDFSKLHTVQEVIDKLNEMLRAHDTAPVEGSARLADLVRRPQLSYDDLAPFDPERPDLPPVIREAVEIRMKYAGYIARQQKQVEEFAREEGRFLPNSIDYLSIQGLRVEARQKLSEIRPLSVGQASRISGVSPADIAVLLIWLEQNKE